MQAIPKKTTSNSIKIAISFLVSGITLFAVSFLFVSEVVGIIGLGLIFWGALFLLITPLKYVDSSLLINTTLPAYMTLDRMLKDFKPKNEAYNIPPCPKDICLPEHLEYLKAMVTFIPEENTNGMLELGDIAEGNFIIEKPKGLLIVSPGVGLLEKIEQKRASDFTKILPSELDEALPNLLSELFLAKEITMVTNENNIRLQIKGSLYMDLYSQEHNLASIKFLGCPLVNAAACAIAKSTGKLTMIQEITTAPNRKSLTVTFKINSGLFEKKRQKLIDVYGDPYLRRNELIEVIQASIRIIDMSFDILIALQGKQIHWMRLEKSVEAFGVNFSFSSVTMPSLNLDLLKILSAIKSQLPQITSKEAYNILKVIYDYFKNLNVDDDTKEKTLNFQSSKSIILAYYTLNDLILAKLVNEKEMTIEVHQLESILQSLENNNSLKIDVEAIIISIRNVIPGNELENSIVRSRGIFKEALDSFLELNKN